VTGTKRGSGITERPIPCAAAGGDINVLVDPLWAGRPGHERGPIDQVIASATIC
jgi:hypothetical protein